MSGPAGVCCCVSLQQRKLEHPGDSTTQRLNAALDAFAAAFIFNMKALSRTRCLPAVP